jgi:nucleoside-diphosphate-sugar epimerase
MSRRPPLPDFASAANTILVVGATGVVGEAALTHFAAASEWNVLAVSRRTPDPVPIGSFEHVGLDLMDPVACRQACERLGRVTHVVYAAVSERAGLVAGWRDPVQMQANLAMLRNLLEPLAEKAPGLQHVSLLQGAKAYGAHAGHRPRLPARERNSRVPHENFYWLQEDLLRDTANQFDFAWTIFRPQVVVGAAWGAAMNPLIPIAVFAALRREEGKPFSYPGGEMQIGEIVDAALLAEALDWATGSFAARNQTFNITNGDVFAWRDAWPLLADELGVDTGPDEPLLLARYLTDRAATWQQIVDRRGLRSLQLGQLLGHSHYYADILLRKDSTAIEYPTLLSTIALRQAGFAECQDSEETLRRWIRVLQKRRLVPTFA